MALEGVDVALAAAMKTVPAVAEKTASFSFALADGGSVVHANSGSAVIGTIQPDATVNFPINTRIDLGQYGAGAFTIAPGAGVTINSYESKLALAGQYAGATLWKKAANVWWLVGNLA